MHLQERGRVGEVRTLCAVLRRLLYVSERHVCHCVKRCRYGNCENIYKAVRISLLRKHHLQGN